MVHSAGEEFERILMNWIAHCSSTESSNPDTCSRLEHASMFLFAFGSGFAIFAALLALFAHLSKSKPILLWSSLTLIVLVVLDAVIYAAAAGLSAFPLLSDSSLGNELERALVRTRTGLLLSAVSLAFIVVASWIPVTSSKYMSRRSVHEPLVLQSLSKDVV